MDVLQLYLIYLFYIHWVIGETNNVEVSCHFSSSRSTAPSLFRSSFCVFSILDCLCIMFRYSCGGRVPAVVHFRSRGTLNILFFFLWRCDPMRVKASSFLRFLDHTQRRTTVGRTPLDESSARRRDLYLSTHNTHNKHPCPRWDSNPRSQQASERPQTYAIDRAATGTGLNIL